MQDVMISRSAGPCRFQFSAADEPPPDAVEAGVRLPLTMRPRTRADMRHADFW